MRVVRPTPLLIQAARILQPVREDVVVIGALAVQVALDGHDVLLTPTRDIDAGSPAERVNEVVAHLERIGLRRSTLEHERAFTWVDGEVKVQLIRPFHPFLKGAARRLPQNNLVATLAEQRWLVAFEEEPEAGLFWTARPAALVALKEAAFGRIRHSGDPVDRDFSDVAMLLDREGERVAEEAGGDPEIRARVLRAAERLATDDAAADASGRELAASGQAENQRAGRALTIAAATGLLADLADSGDDHAA